LDGTYPPPRGYVKNNTDAALIGDMDGVMGPISKSEDGKLLVVAAKHISGAWRK